MFKILMASQPARTGWFGSTAFSAVAHGTLISAALFTTGRAPTAVREVRGTTAERVTYVLPRSWPTRRPLIGTLARPKAAKVARANVPLKAPDVATLAARIAQAIDVPLAPAAPDLTAMTIEWLTRPDALSTRQQAPAELLAERSAFVRPENGVYTMDMVEVSVAPKQGNPLPRYPTMLQDMGIEGSFIVQFVVDSTGVVPENTIDFPRSMHRLFADAVRAALRRSHYQPARIGGQAVTELVNQEFRFVMRKP
jgi:TonB family protein